MRCLLHVCCGPCAIYPIEVLKEEGIEVFMYYSNPNIHPFEEWVRRLDGAKKVAEKFGVRLIVDDRYPLRDFLRAIAFREDTRCIYCYSVRIEKTARLAKKSGFDLFTTTLLYSKFQKHDLIKEICESSSKRYGVGFCYRDFREGWKRGIEASKELGIYRQDYCGCIYSEYESRGRRWKNALKLR